MRFRIGGILFVGLTLLLINTAEAGGGAGTTFLGGDLSFNGFVRQEDAISTTGETGPTNQFGDPANGVVIKRDAGNPLTGWTTPLNVGGILGNGNPVTNVVLGVVAGGSNPRGVIATSGVSDTFARYVPREHPDMNYHVLRMETSQSLAWGNWSVVSRVRAVYDPGGLGYRDFNYADYSDINGGISGGNANEYHGKPSYFGFPVEGKRNPLWFERSGRNYQIDFPALFAQWTDGNLTARIGNQSVAWGQLLFFRIMDTANGLDLRRHIILNRALEEYSDVRESAPGLRLTWQATNEITIDSFAQQFIPTILPSANTPYNIVPSQFTIHDRYTEEGYNKKLNYGLRAKGEFGNYNLQAMFTRRYNQLGAIRWTASGVNKALPNSNALGLAFNQYCAGILALSGEQTNNGCGPILAKTAFEVAPAGVFSAEEWFNYAGGIRLDGLDGLNRAIDQFPAAERLLAQPIGRDVNAANNELDAFFMAGEGLRGHIERKYFAENIFGVGGGYVTEGEPGSLWDQLIFNMEATYTPKRVFTAIDLGQDFHKQDDAQIGLVAEKYQRFFTSIPATYLVFQYLWQKNSDLAGLLLKGYGSENFSDQNVVLNKNVPTNANPKIAPGVNHANYLVFAFLQPTDAYIFEFSAAALVDTRGGLLIQPAVQWKPRGDVTVNLFYNYINGNAWGGNANKNTVSFFDAADELSFRIGYQF